MVIQWCLMVVEWWFNGDSMVIWEYQPNAIYRRIPKHEATVSGYDVTVSGRTASAVTETFQCDTTLGGDPDNILGTEQRYTLW